MVSLGAGSLSILVSADLCLDCVPVNLDIFGVLFKLVNLLLLLILLQEASTIGNYCINMGLVVQCNVEGFFPAVKLDVQLDGSVEEARLKQDLLGLVHLFAIHGKGSITGWLRWKLFDVVDKLNLIGFINSC